MNITVEYRPQFWKLRILETTYLFSSHRVDRFTFEDGIHELLYERPEHE